ncbi:Retinoid isomerohydrolase [Homalodisca vitripennis]|nr:Retinoid isomerohydrolase [Homalodisca vitripennis]
MRVGPGLFDLDDFTVNHWFDGFAVVYKFEISKNKVTFIKKYLQSDAYKKAMAAKRPVYTEFGTKAHSDVTKSIFSRVICSVIPELTDNCAVNIFTFNGQVFVSSESANIRQINPKTLETLDKLGECLALNAFLLHLKSSRLIFHFLPYNGKGHLTDCVPHVFRLHHVRDQSLSRTLYPKSDRSKSPPSSHDNCLSLLWGQLKSQFLQMIPNSCNGFIGSLH